MSVVLYSAHCPKCVILEKKLKMSKVDYSVVTDADLMIEKGFTEIPMLEVDGELLGFKAAIEWANKRTE